MAKFTTLASGVLRKHFQQGELRQTKLGEICPEARALFPFFFQLPYNDPIALLKWRIYVRRRCILDLEFRAKVWEMAARDAAFCIVTFFVLFEPRPLPRWLPFNLWDDQTSLLAWFTEIFGERDAAVNKTRGIGVSWLMSAFVFHKWLFVEGVEIAGLTKDKDLLDSPKSNSLLGKFQFLYDTLPEWAKYTKDGRPKLKRLAENNIFINVDNGASIQGFVCTSTKMRQLRFTFIFAEEFAFWDRTDQAEWMTTTQGCSNSRLLISTWNDFDDMFHQVLYEEDTALLKIEAFWWNNQERWRGAYKIMAGRVVFTDFEYKHDQGYRFGYPELLDEGTLRSPWVDAELSRPGVDRLKTLRDLYGMMVAERSNSFFDVRTKKAVKASILEVAPVQGMLFYPNGQLEIAPTLKSDIRVFAELKKDEKGRLLPPESGPFTMFDDLGHGADAAFTVCSVVDRFGEQVLEYGRKDRSITDFAADSVAIARWLSGDNGDGWCLIDFESNGPLAKPFLAELQRLNYGMIHYSNYKSLSQYQSKTGRVLAQGEVPKFGGTNNPDAGLANFREFERAVLSMDLRVRSAKVSDDMRLMGKDEDGFPKFPKKRREGHGDFVHGLAGAWWRCRSVVSREPVESEKGRDANPWESKQNSRWSAGR